MATYNYGQLEQLWQQAGGSAKLAPVMAAIALAESGGRTTATHKDSDGSTDYGLWQINSVHGYNTAKLLASPVYNAQAAVSIEHSSGLGAWSTYNNGSYKKYLGGSAGTANVWGLPYNPRDTKPTQIDQGVDFASSSPYIAVAPGRVVHIDPNFYNGTPAVYIRLDQPVTVNGHTYKGVYYSETAARVHVGQHVSTGQVVSAPGNAEIGFANKFGSSASSWLPAAHGTYNGRDPTQAGNDFSSITVKKGNGGVLSVLSNIASQIPTPAGGLTFGQAKAGASGAASAASATVGAAESVTDFLGKLGSAAFWLRAAEVIGGGVLALLGLYLLARQIGLGELPVPLPSGATTAADQAATAAMTQKFRENEAKQQRSEAREQRAAESHAAAAASREAKERRAEEAHMAQLEHRSAQADLARARAETARTNRRPRMESHSLDTPTRTRRQRLAARSSDPATNEIPF